MTAAVPRTAARTGSVHPYPSAPEFCGCRSLRNIKRVDGAGLFIDFASFDKMG